MLLIDDLLAAPVRGLMFVLKEIAKSVEAEREAEERAVMSELTELHRQLDADRMAEAEFDARESELLTRLERLRGGAEDDGASG